MKLALRGGGSADSSTAIGAAFVLRGMSCSGGPSDGIGCPSAMGSDPLHSVAGSAVSQQSRGVNSHCPAGVLVIAALNAVSVTGRMAGRRSAARTSGRAIRDHSPQL
jgi:hypothetical protein